MAYSTLTKDTLTHVWCYNSCSYKVLRKRSLLSLPFLNNFAWILVILASFMIWDRDRAREGASIRVLTAAFAACIPLPAPSSSAGRAYFFPYNSLTLRGWNTTQASAPCLANIHLNWSKFLHFPKGRRIWRCSVLEILTKNVDSMSGELCIGLHFGMRSLFLNAIPSSTSMVNPVLPKECK